MTHTSSPSQLTSLTLPLNTLSNTVLLLLSIWLHLTCCPFHLSVAPISYARPLSSSSSCFLPLSSSSSLHLHPINLICPSFLNIHLSLTHPSSLLLISLFLFAFHLSSIHQPALSSLHFYSSRHRYPLCLPLDISSYRTPVRSSSPLSLSLLLHCFFLLLHRLPSIFITLFSCLLSI